MPLDCSLLGGHRYHHLDYHSVPLFTGLSNLFPPLGYGLGMRLLSVMLAV